MGNRAGNHNSPRVFDESELVGVCRLVEFDDPKDYERLRTFINQSLAQKEIEEVSQDGRFYVEVLTKKQCEIALRNDSFSPSRIYRAISSFVEWQSLSEIPSAITRSKVVGGRSLRFFTLDYTPIANDILLTQRNSLLGKIGMKDFAISSPPIAVLKTSVLDRELLNPRMAVFKTLDLTNAKITFGPTIPF